MIKPQSSTPAIDTSQWPSSSRTMTASTSVPVTTLPSPPVLSLKRPLLDYIRYGVINLQPFLSRGRRLDQAESSVSRRQGTVELSTLRSRVISLSASTELHGS
uniref:Uncharacterized protein n=1 Tax=Brassica oleracea TaxID=3712 RepID=A0A3P6DM04_BRAOL|nr:unnamed protein product [Brassica oleracea]